MTSRRCAAVVSTLRAGISATALTTVEGNRPALGRAIPLLSNGQTVVVGRPPHSQLQILHLQSSRKYPNWPTQRHAQISRLCLFSLAY